MLACKQTSKLITEIGTKDNPRKMSDYLAIHVFKKLNLKSTS